MAGARGAARRQLVGRALRRRNRLRREWTWPRIPWRALASLAPLLAVAVAAPRAWQERHGERVAVDAAFRVVGPWGAGSSLGSAGAGPDPRKARLDVTQLNTESGKRSDY